MCSRARARSSRRNTSPASSADPMAAPARARFALTALVAVALVIASIMGASGVAAKGVTLRGAGATFPAPLYEKWIQTYLRENPGVSISYEAVGSSEGQRRFLA